MELKGSMKDIIESDLIISIRVSHDGTFTVVVEKDRFVPMGNQEPFSTREHMACLSEVHRLLVGAHG